MLVFADYDNIDDLIKARGLEHIVGRIVSAISKLPIVVQPRIDVRFYGGWFIGSQLTKVGQGVSAEISSVFPKRYTLPWSGHTDVVDVLANCQIARSLAAAEQIPLHHTFRRRPFKGRLYFKQPATSLCNSINCPLDAVEWFLDNQGCKNAGCTVLQHHVLERFEQKLVDMLHLQEVLERSKGSSKSFFELLQKGA